MRLKWAPSGPGGRADKRGARPAGATPRARCGKRLRTRLRNGRLGRARPARRAAPSKVGQGSPGWRGSPRVGESRQARALAPGTPGIQARRPRTLAASTPPRSNCGVAGRDVVRRAWSDRGVGASPRIRCVPPRVPAPGPAARPAPGKEGCSWPHLRHPMRESVRSRAGG